MLPAKPLYRTLLLLPLIVIGIAAWAFFWPGVTCSDPACARKRFDVHVELDSFRGIEPVPLEVQTGTERVSARSILLSGGIDLDIELDDDALPYALESGPLDRADLYQYSLAWRNRAAPSHVDAQIYAVMTPALVSDRGERLFGIMFDSAGREGIAVAPRETERTFGKGEGESIPLLQLRTFIHEMLHAFNRRHLDAVQTNDGRLTLEAPTRCIVDSQAGQWFLAESPAMILSPSTIQFFQTAPARDVLPGGTNTPFSGLRGSATECEDVRSNDMHAGVDSRWELAKRRLWGLVGIQSAASQALIDEVEQVDETPALELRVQAQQAAYPLGYPIAVRLMVWNRSNEPLPLKDRLSPSYGLVEIEYRFKDAEDWQAYRPLAWYEAAADDEAMLAPEGYHEQTAAIYYGDGGWTFQRPGDYELRAKVRMSEEAPDIVSNVVVIGVAAPQTESEQAVLEPLLDSEGALDAGIGRLLIFGGRIGDPEAQAPLERAAGLHADTALGSALQLTLASQRLSPPIDPLTGERGAPDFENARDLLNDTCTDSGIAALKYELLARFANDIPPSLTLQMQSSQESWDGETRSGDPIATYSDERLRPFSASLHFCPKSATLSGEPRTAVNRIAQALRRADPARIVLVGHADDPGACRFNDTLAMKRAEAVKAALLKAGVPDENIRIATLGERRPVDFSATPEASQLNRRVEVLVELPGQGEMEEIEAAPEGQSEPQEPAEEVPPQSEIERVLPRC